MDEHRTRRRAPWSRRRVGGLLAAALLFTPCLVGCHRGGSQGKLRSESLGPQPVFLGAEYSTAVYQHRDEGDTSFFLTDIPLGALLAGTARDGQLVHVELLWRPKPGATPMDASATNASIRHVVISGGEVGVYGGSGFALPRGRPGRARLKVTVREATVRLLEATPGFTDPLSPARMVGSFTVTLDPAQARRLQRAISQIVTNAMGERQYVRRGDGPDLG